MPCLLNMKPLNYKYHLAIRLKGYDYSNPGIYFITICADDRSEIFGAILNDQSILNVAGQLADTLWREIPQHFCHSSLLDHIVMPNHIHGLICLTEDEKGTACRASTKQNIESFGRPTRGSIPTIIRSYKSALTKIIHEKDPKSPKRIWQPGYYEHVVRDQKELEYTIDYIKSNPANWEAEKRIIYGNHESFV